MIIARIRCKIETQLLQWKTNRKSYVAYQMTPFLPVTITDFLSHIPRDIQHVLVFARPEDFGRILQKLYGPKERSSRVQL